MENAENDDKKREASLPGSLHLDNRRHPLLFLLRSAAGKYEDHGVFAGYSLADFEQILHF